MVQQDINVIIVQKNYDMSYFKSKCKKCQNLFYEILHFILLKLLYYIIVIFICSLNGNILNKLHVSGILMRIWLNCSFTFIAYGFFIPNMNSFISKYWYLYKTAFSYHMKIFAYYLRVQCLLNSLNINLSYNQMWYIQKYMNICTPIFDSIFITILLFAVIHIYKFFFYKKNIDIFEQLLCTIPELNTLYKKNCIDNIHKVKNKKFANKVESFEENENQNKEKKK